MRDNIISPEKYDRAMTIIKYMESKGSGTLQDVQEYNEAVHIMMLHHIDCLTMRIEDLERNEHEHDKIES